jgi:NAD(P)-dependent dehydrogenase (short-subunit alcohol dehydrogenase family)
MLQPGETVLVLGATGVSGRIAVALAARMGAGRVIAAGRNRASPSRRPFAAITRRGLAHAAPRVRLVEVGQMAGPTISLPADVLRSFGLEILGSGPGTISLAEITRAIPEFLSLAATGDPADRHRQGTLAEVEPAWHRRSGGRRIVFRT